jgi:uncharacterized repeat protein (TIGR03803 family)
MTIAGVLAATIVGFALPCDGTVEPPVEKVLYQFMGAPDGGNPEMSALVFDSVGNLYGTTAGGGTYGWGTVFELTPRQDGGWAENILYIFTGSADGGEPLTGVTFDKVGNLYGTTLTGGVHGTNCDAEGCGTVFELAPNLDGTWTESVIYNFGEGDFPTWGVTFDDVGNLYGVTGFSGQYNAGAVFELSPIRSGGWTKSTLYTFTGGADGRLPYGGLVFDAKGNLYGSTYEGGKGSCNNGCGTVFELSPTGDGGWSGSQLHAFTGGDDGAVPVGNLTLDAAGNVYGTTTSGISQGRNYGGEVFMLSPASSGRWRLRVLHAFDWHEGGGLPNGGLVFDSSGNLYGTTQAGPPGSGGMVFELSPGTGDFVRFRSFSLLYDDGFQPLAGVVLDSAGDVYSTTLGGGSDTRCGNGCGVVFEVTP